jgi:hypothetical protein
MDYFNPKYALNITRDWSQLQGFTHPTDDHIQIHRDLNARYITIENSGKRPVGIAITTYFCGPKPKMQFVMHDGEIKHLGINPQGSAMQFIFMFDPISVEYIGSPTAFRTDANSFVIREGLNGMWIDFYFRSSYAAAK